MLEKVHQEVNNTVQCLHMKTISIMFQMTHKQLSEVQVSCHHICGGSTSDVIYISG